MTQEKFDELYDDAVRLYAAGHDDEYVKSQHEEQNIDSRTTEDILKKIKSLWKAGKRRSGLKLAIGGLTMVIVAFAFTCLSFTDGSPIGYVLYGLVIVGVITFGKGLIDVILP